MKYLAPICVVVAMGAASVSLSSAQTGDIVASTGQDERAASITTMTATCGDMNLKVIAGYDDNVSPAPHRFIAPSIEMNGRPLAIEGSALAAALGRRHSLVKYAPYCGRPADAVYVRYYSISKAGDAIVYRVGSFTVRKSGGSEFHGEEQVPPGDFWFG